MSDNRKPVAHLLVGDQREALFMEDITAIIMALEGRSDMIKDGLRLRLKTRLESLYTVPFKRLTK